MTFGSLFAGIGGFDLGLERAGMICRWQVEINSFCRKILRKHWPNTPKHKDIKNVGAHNLETVDLICGGFPCQPFSLAGQQRGEDDNRYLWPQMSRIIKELKPTWIVGENVPGIVNMGLDKVLSDLETAGYETWTFILPACSIGAEHLRYRVWIMGYAGKQGLEGLREEDWRDSLQSVEDSFPRYNGQAAPRVLRKIDGFSRKLDKPVNYEERIKALGNAVMPQIVEIIGRSIIKVTQLKYFKNK